MDATPADATPPDSRGSPRDPQAPVRDYVVGFDPGDEARLFATVGRMLKDREAKQ
jgi:hypothetical protein